MGGQDWRRRDRRRRRPGLGEQTVQALRNVLTVLQEVGATQEDVARLTIHLAAGSDVRAAFEASREVWGPHATAVTVLMVASLGRPGASWRSMRWLPCPGGPKHSGPVRPCGRWAVALHEPDYRASVRHEGAIPLAPTSPTCGCTVNLCSLTATSPSSHAFSFGAGWTATISAPIASQAPRRRRGS